MSTLRFALVLAVSAATGVLACDGELEVIERANQDGGAAAPSGGSAGSAPTGGAPGAGSAGAAGAAPFVLDDFEDGDTQSSNISEGYWYSRPDGTCSVGLSIESTPERAPNTHAIRFRGGGCTAWGALLGLDLGGAGESFDASSFDSLRFSVRAEAGSVTTLNVSLLDPLHFDVMLEASTDWRDVSLPFSGFTFNEAGPEEPFDTDRLTHLQFFVFSPESFDIWLDDLAFVRAE
jgi:hypothetical protein